MDINSLIQTIVFMNIKDIGNMSFIDMIPILLFSLFYTYKDVLINLFDVNKIRNRFYTSEIITDMAFDNKGLIRICNSSKVLLWLYVNNISNVKKSKSIKENYFSMSLKRDDKNNYLYDFYLPNENCTIEFSSIHSKTIYLEFIYTTENRKVNNNNSFNSGANNNEEVVKDRVLTLKLKSKQLNNEQLIEWLSEQEKEYTKWTNIDKCLYIYTSIIEKTHLEFCRYIFNSTKSFDNLFFEGKELIMERLETYKNIKKYEMLGIPHSLGFLFYGEPGCGKTSCIKAIAKYLKRHIVTINLNHIKNIDDLKTLFMSKGLTKNDGWYLELHKRIYVFEEIDCFQGEDNPFLDRSLKSNLYNNNKNKEEDKIEKLASMLIKEEKTEIKITSKLTTGEVLEVLDGITEAEDRIIIFTTNHPEKIDKAFMRPGRIDVSINFKKLRRQDINNLYKLWFGKSINEKTLNKIKDYTFSQADFGKLCFENNAETVLQKLIKDS